MPEILPDGAYRAKNPRRASNSVTGLRAEKWKHCRVSNRSGLHITPVLPRAVMKTEDMRPAASETKPSEQLGIIFMPFARLTRGHTIAGVEFLPLRDGDGNVPAVLESAVAALDRILSGYVDRHGKPFTNC